MTVNITAIATYEPVWQDGIRRVAGTDEDVVTLSVAAAKALLGDEGTPIERVLVVSRRPGVLDGVGLGVVSRALGLPADVPVELRVGGAPAALDSLMSSTAGTLVIGVDVDEPATAAAAALVGPSQAGLALDPSGRAWGSLPMRVQHVGAASPTEYQDSRVERELATFPLIHKFGSSDLATYVAGVASRDAERVGAQPNGAPTDGAASPIFLLAELVNIEETVRLVALDAATAVAADVRPGGAVSVSHERREPLPVERRPTMLGGEAEIPFSMPAYSRAFDAKVGLRAARCECGELSYPPRLVCLQCDRYDSTEPVDLPRTGEVYTTITVHTPVPGIAGPYALAIVSLDDSPVRVLAQVADAVAPSTRIGESGRLVLRLVATRDGVPDYGYSFQAAQPYEQPA